MSRPRKPQDPVRWPIPCARCGQHNQIAANWPDGAVCCYCYQQAKRTRGICACGHEGVLPGRVADKPVCRDCSGVTVNVDCRSCGAEDEIYSGGNCWTCTLASTVDRLLTNPSTGDRAPHLEPFAQALKSMKRANSGLTWIRQKHVTSFLMDLAVAPAMTHAAVDALPKSPTREFVRDLLVEHGVLPRRDLYRARYDEWSRQALERVTDPVSREIIRRYIRWHHQRRMNQMDQVSHGTFLRSKQSVTVAIDLLNWLTDHAVTLGELEQQHLDVWQATGPSTRLLSSLFLNWAIKTRLVDPDLKINRPRRGTSPRMTAIDQEQAVQRVVHTNELTARDRAAAILVLVFGQQMQDVVGLTWKDVKVTEQLVTVRVGAIEIALPDPLDGPWRQLASRPGNDLTAAHPNSDWVFPGYSPGRPISAGYLRTRLRHVFATRAGRLGTLHELTKLAPVAVLAEALGYSAATVERHAVDSATAYARYVGEVKSDGLQPTEHSASEPQTSKPPVPAPLHS